MVRQTAVKKPRKKPVDTNGKRPRLDFRFADHEHQELALQAAKKDGNSSLNAWIVRVTLKAAREELGIAD